MTARKPKRTPHEDAKPPSTPVPTKVPSKPGRLFGGTTSA
jgi:hypothetical protein